jgi:hypothetical protein
MQNIVGQFRQPFFSSFHIACPAQSIGALHAIELCPRWGSENKNVLDESFDTTVSQALPFRILMCRSWWEDDEISCTALSVLVDQSRGILDILLLSITIS